MNKYQFRVVVSRFLYKHIGVYREFSNQGQLADYLGVRQATVSSWINKNSSIDLFVFFQICQAFAEKGKKDVRTVFAEFMEVYKDYKLP